MEGTTALAVTFGGVAVSAEGPDDKKGGVSKKEQASAIKAAKEINRLSNYSMNEYQEANLADRIASSVDSGNIVAINVGEFKFNVHRKDSGCCLSSSVEFPVKNADAGGRGELVVNPPKSLDVDASGGNDDRPSVEKLKDMIGVVAPSKRMIS